MNDIAVIHLTNGGFTVVDADLFNELNKFRWQRDVGRYNTDHVYRSFSENGISRTVAMHRMILNAPNGIPVDHKNGFGLDNTRRNLRLASKSNNAANSTPKKRKPESKWSSMFKGVYKRPDCVSKPWVARIGAGENFKHLGYYDSETKAAESYNRAAIQRFGEFAKLNNLNTEVSIGL